MLTMKKSYISHVLLLELKFVSRDQSMEGNLLNHFIHLDYKQFMKIVHNGG